MNNLEKKAKNNEWSWSNYSASIPDLTTAYERDIWRETSCASQLLDIKFSRLIDKYTPYIFSLSILTNRQQFSMVCTVIHLIEMSSKRRQNMLLTSVPYKIIPNKTKKPALRPQWSMLITVRWTVFEIHIYGVELTRKIIIQEYFQAKIVRKIRIFSLGRKNNILIIKSV